MELVNSETLGFFRVAVASPKNEVCDIQKNGSLVLDDIFFAEKEGANLILFPQLTITASTAADLYFQNLVLEKSFSAIMEIAAKTEDLNIISAIGLPVFVKNKIYSVMAVLFKGEILGLVPLCNDFDDEHFYINNIQVSGNLIFDVKFNTGFTFGFCNLKWNQTIENLPELLIMPLSQPSFPLSLKKLKEQTAFISEEVNAALCFANCNIGESTSEFVFTGEAGIFENGIELESSSLAENSHLIFSDIDIELIKTKRAKENRSKIFRAKQTGKKLTINLTALKKNKEKTKKYLLRPVSKNPFLPDYLSESDKSNFFRELIFLQAAGLVKRLKHIECSKCVIGLSGGLDSTLSFLALVYTFDLLNISYKNIYAVTMPGFGTTDTTKNNSLELAELFETTVKKINIRAAVIQHFKDIEHSEDLHDTVYENAQARERTQILMDIANKVGGIMIGTGDLSEAALGWTTYNGDHISMYDVNSSIPKTLIKHCLLSFVENKIFFKNENEKNQSEKNKKLKNILLSVIETPVSPELLPPKDGKITQKTENIIGSYELHDFFLYNIVENCFPPKKIFYLTKIVFNKYSNLEILNRLELFYKRFFSQQFKRVASADGANVSGFSLSPRTAFKMPSDVVSKLWLKEIKELKKWET